MILFELDSKKRSQYHDQSVEGEGRNVSVALAKLSAIRELEPTDSKGIKPADWQIELQKTLVVNHFHPKLATLPQVVGWVELYGLKTLCIVISQIGQMVEKQLRQDEFIAHGFELLKETLENGHSFVGSPLLYLNSNKQLLIRWIKLIGKTNYLEINNTGLYCEAAGLVLSRPAIPAPDYESLLTIFAYLKTTLPNKYLNDGCDMRCAWISFHLENIYGYEYEKIKVAHKDGQLFELRPPFQNQGPPLGWKMHTAPIVTLANGERFVMDIALDKPIPFDQWLSSLHSNFNDCMTTRSTHWNVDCGQDCTSDQKTSLPALLVDLRGLYLFEMVDGNQTTNPDGSLRRTMNWMSWVNDSRGFIPMPIQPATEKVKVIVDLEKIDSGKYQARTTHQAKNASFVEDPINGLIFASHALLQKHLIYSRKGLLTI